MNTISNNDRLPLVCIDTETNGLALHDDVLAISVRLLKDNGIPTDEEFYTLIRSDQPINTEAYAVNGITQEQRTTAPTKEEVCLNLQQWWTKTCYGIQLSPIGHNFLGFDKPRVELLLGDLYNKMFHYHSDDSMVIARSLQRCGMLPVSSCSLKNLVAFFRIPYNRAHNASGDTYMCGLIYSKLQRILRPTLKTRLIRVIKPYYIGI